MINQLYDYITNCNPPISETITIKTEIDEWKR